MKTTSKAFLASMALHLALLLALAFLRPHFELGSGADRRYIEVVVVNSMGPLESASLTAETGDPAEAAREDSESGNPAEVADEGREAATDETTETPPEALADARSETPPATAEEAPPLATIEEDRAVQRLAATDSPPTAEATPPPSALADEPVPPEPVAPEPIAAEPIAAGSIAAAPIRHEPPPLDAIVAETGLVEAIAREPIAAAEAVLIEERVEQWARSFAALGEWETTTSWTDRDGDYSAEVTHVPDGNGSGYDEAIVTVTTERDGRTYATEVRMRRLGFSHYAQFVDRWDPGVRIHDDRIDGRFHSNSEIYVDRTADVQPTFLGKVTTASRVNTSLSDRRIRRDQVFVGGLEERVGRIALPKTVPVPTGDEMRAGQALRLETDTRIIFTAGGTLTWTPLPSRRARRRGQSPPAGRTLALTPGEPFYIVANEDASVYVRGTVNGRVLVYSPADIIIEGDLVYAAHPLADAASDDYLGLVAERSVDVAEPSITGPGDLEIHAAIYAHRRFAVRSYRTRSQGTLTIIGSLTAGSLSASEPRYATNLKFDTRLAEVRPPRFPVTDRYEIAAWDSRWSVAGDPDPDDTGVVDASRTFEDRRAPRDAAQD